MPVPETSTRRDRGPLVREVLPYSADMWDRLRGDWDRVAARSGVGSAFTSAAWVDSWMHVFGAEHRPTGVIWRGRHGEVVGNALVPTARVHLGPFPLVRAYLNASGPEGALCEHNDLLVEPSWRAEAARDLVRLLLDTGIDELALVGMREAAADEIAAAWPTEAWRGFSSESPYVALEELRAAGGDYLAALSGNTRSQVRRSRRLYEERFGAPRVETAAAGEAASAWFDEMVELHRARWRSRGEEGAFTPAARRFHERLTSRSGAGADGLRTTLLRLRFGDVTVAILYYLEQGGRVNFYQSGLRYDDDARLKPGLVAHAAGVEHYLAAGAVEYDFLGGDRETARYKQSLSTHSRLLTWRDFPAPKPRVRFVGGLRRIRHALLARAATP